MARLDDPTPRVWSQDAWTQLATRVSGLAKGGGETNLYFETISSGNVRWARNRINTSGDTRDTQLRIARRMQGASLELSLNQVSDPVLHSAMQYLEEGLPLYQWQSMSAELEPPFPASDYLKPKLWFQSTYDLDAASRAKSANAVIGPAEHSGMLSAGYLEATASGHAVWKPEQQMALYYPMTEVQYSITVRDAGGTGSGWAGVNWNDWTRLDVAKLASVATDKALRSRNPSRLEPGRYTAILEPQALFGLMVGITGDGDDPNSKTDMLSWARAIGGISPYAHPVVPGMTKIGTRIVDERLSMTSDPMMPDLGFLPFDDEGEPCFPATWIERGVLKNLAYNRRFAVQNGLGNRGLPFSNSYRLFTKDPTTSIDEMIATTKRGVWVTRFWDVRLTGPGSSGASLCSGYTRDGLWLIENGKVTKPIKNFYFDESPFFVLNQVEQIGQSQRVFAPGRSVAVPSIKVRDFNFTRLSDAV